MAAERRPLARILIVDDHEDNVEVIRARLEASGYQIESAADGEEALERVRSSPPDLILLDVMMPRIDGMEVARQIKADEALPSSRSSCKPPPTPCSPKSRGLARAPTTTARNRTTSPNPERP